MNKYTIIILCILPASLFSMANTSSASNSYEERVRVLHRSIEPLSPAHSALNLLKECHVTGKKGKFSTDEMAALISHNVIIRSEGTEEEYRYDRDFVNAIFLSLENQYRKNKDLANHIRRVYESLIQGEIQYSAFEHALLVAHGIIRNIFCKADSYTQTLLDWGFIVPAREDLYILKDDVKVILMYEYAREKTAKRDGMLIMPKKPVERPVEFDFRKVFPLQPIPFQDTDKKRLRMFGAVLQNSFH